MVGPRACNPWTHHRAGGNSTVATVRPLLPCSRLSLSAILKFMWNRTANLNILRGVRSLCVLALLVFVHAFALRPLLLPECLAHGFGDGSMAHAMPGHDHGDGETADHADSHAGHHTSSSGQVSAPLHAAHHSGGTGQIDPALHHLAGLFAGHANAPNSAADCLCLEVCLCEFGSLSPTPPLLEGAVTVIVAAALPSPPDAPTVSAPAFILPFATGPPGALALPGSRVHPII